MEASGPQSPGPAQGAAPASQPAQHQRPATHDDLRSLRRWVLVAGVWAVAATAVAIIALLDKSNNDANRRSGDAARAVTRVEQRLGKRLDNLESKLNGLPTSDDLQRLQTRVSGAEDKANQASDDAKAARDSIKSLGDRVKTLEESSSSGGGGNPAGGSPP